MCFRDLQNSGKRSSRSSRPPSSHAVAAAISQIYIAFYGFRRLVDAIGTPRDTPDHRLHLNMTRYRISSLVMKASAKLKSLSEFDRGINVDENKKIESAKLAKDFQTIVKEFQKVQKLASERQYAFSPSAPPSSVPARSSWCC